MKKLSIALVAALLLVGLSGCSLGLSMGINNPLGMQLGASDQEATGKNPLWNAAFDITQEDFITQMGTALSPGKGPLVFTATPREREVEENGYQYREFRYRLEESFTYTVFVEQSSGKVARILIETPTPAEGEGIEADYQKYLLASAQVLLDVTDPGTQYEISQISALVRSRANQYEYHQQTIQMGKAYLTFQSDIDKNTSFTIQAVTEYEEWQSINYFDGEKYHTFLGPNDSFRPHTPQDLMGIASDYLMRGLPLPDKLEEDLPPEFFLGNPALARKEEPVALPLESSQEESIDGSEGAETASSGENIADGSSLESASESPAESKASSLPAS